MKLLSIKEALSKKNRQQTLQVLRAQEIGEELDERRTTLNELREQFDLTLKNQQEVWAKEKEDHATWRNEAQTEVMRLEERRFLALLPLEKDKEKLNNERQTFEADKALFDAEKLVFEENKLSFTARLDQVAERELQVSKAEQSVSIRQQGVEQQAISIGAQSKQLTEQLVEFSREMERKNNDLATRETVLKSQTTANEVQAGYLKHWEFDLKQLQVGIRDGYTQLEKSKQEILNNKQ